MHYEQYLVNGLVFKHYMYTPVSVKYKTYILPRKDCVGVIVHIKYL